MSTTTLKPHGRPAMPVCTHGTIRTEDLGEHVTGKRYHTRRGQRHLHQVVVATLATQHQPTRRTEPPAITESDTDTVSATSTESTASPSR